MIDEEQLEGNSAEEESPYRRRRKPIEVRRLTLGRRMGRYAPWVLLGAAAILAVGYGTYRIAYFALNSPYFLVSSPSAVVIRGNEYVTREEVLDILGFSSRPELAVGYNIFRYPLEEKRKQLQQLPWVRAATVGRILPDQLVVEIVERKPVAFVKLGGRVMLVDEEGIFLGRPNHGRFDFPVLTGLEVQAGPAARRSRMAFYLEFLRQVSGEVARSGWTISEVDLADSDDLRALLIRGGETIRVHFGNQEYIQRFNNFLTLLPEMRRANARIDSVDLRYRNQVVVNPQTSPSGATPLAAAGGKE